MERIKISSRRFIIIYLPLIYAILFASCEQPNKYLMRFPENEVLISGRWTGYTIEAGEYTFSTKVGLPASNVQCWVVFHEGQWYLWLNRYIDIFFFDGKKKAPEGEGVKP